MAADLRIHYSTLHEIRILPAPRPCAQSRPGQRPKDLGSQSHRVPPCPILHRISIVSTQAESTAVGCGPYVLIAAPHLGRPVR